MFSAKNEKGDFSITKSKQRNMNTGERLEIIRQILVLMQTQAGYRVWLPSADVLSSIEDLLSRRIGLSRQRVAAFVVQLEEQQMGIAEICDLMVNEVVSIFGFSAAEAKTFVDGLDYIIEARQLEHFSDAELLKRCAQAVSECINAEQQIV